MTRAADSGPTPQRHSIGARRSPAAQAAILDAARALLAESGYAGFSIDAVARRAGAGKPTVYRWWKTRADLLIDVYATEKAAAMPPPDTGSLAGDLRLYTRALWRFWSDTPSGRAFRALIAEAQSNDASMAVLRDRFMPERLRDLSALFERAVRRGEIGPDEIAARLALYIGFNWYRVLTDRLDEADPDLDLALQLTSAPLPAPAEPAR